MTSYNKRVYDMLVRVLVFRTNYADLIAGVPQAGALFDTVNQVFQTMTEQFGTQMSGKNDIRVSSRAREELRTKLRYNLELLCRIAKGMGLEGFFIPRERNDQAVANAVRIYAAKAARSERQFVEHGMQEGFLEQLRSEGERLDEAIHQLESAKHLRKVAGSELGRIQSEVLEVLNRLDPVMENVFRDNPGLLPIWYSARQVHRPSPKKAVESQPVTQPV